MVSMAPRERILALASQRGSVSSREAVRACGLSRQAVHTHLAALVRSGDLEVEGAGRATRYRFRTERRFSFPVAGAAEDALWSELVRRCRELRDLPADAEHVVHYALTELLNNAIDHARARELGVEVSLERGVLTLVVSDDGVGLFEHARKSLGLESHLVALQEISKGRVTSAPDRHAGEGLFFTSKVVDYFEADANGLKWIVDNVRPEVGVGAGTKKAGTRVEVRMRPSAPRSLRALFDAYTKDFEFTKTKTVVKLFAVGVTLISRSEARRLLHGLEKFTEVILDFAGVTAIGQGFADEVFRVWGRAHPGTSFVPVNMIEPVEFMVRRALEQAGR